MVDINFHAMYGTPSIRAPITPAWMDHTSWSFAPSSCSHVDSWSAPDFRSDLIHRVDLARDTAEKIADQLWRRRLSCWIRPATERNTVRTEAWAVSISMLTEPKVLTTDSIVSKAYDKGSRDWMIQKRLSILFTYLITLYFDSLFLPCLVIAQFHDKCLSTQFVQV